MSSMTNKRIANFWLSHIDACVLFSFCVSGLAYYGLFPFVGGHWFVLALVVLAVQALILYLVDMFTARHGDRELHEQIVSNMPSRDERRIAYIERTVRDLSDQKLIAEFDQLMSRRNRDNRFWSDFHKLAKLIVHESVAESEVKSIWYREQMGLL